MRSSVKSCTLGRDAFRPLILDGVKGQAFNSCLTFCRHVEASHLFLFESSNADVMKDGLGLTPNRSFVTRQGLTVLIFLPCLFYSWTQPLTPHLVESP